MKENRNLVGDMAISIGAGVALAVTYCFGFRLFCNTVAAVFDKCSE